MIEQASVLLEANAPVTDPISWPDYAAVGIAALSLIVSLVLGVRNRGTAKRALKLSEEQEARRSPRLAIHVNDSVSWRRALAGERLLGFHLLVSNPTDRPSSLLKAELHLTYAVDSIMTTIKLPHTSYSLQVGLPSAVVPIELPAPLGANDAVSGWFLFRVAEGLTGGRPVDRYDIVIRDIHDIVETLQVTVFREVPDVEAT